MKEHHSEQAITRLDNPEFYLQLQNAIADRLDDLATDPKLKNGDISLDLGEKIRKGEKVQGFVIVRDAIISVGHDFRLTPDEIDVVQQKFLEEFFV